jgi:hypothetical protein
MHHLRVSRSSGTLVSTEIGFSSPTELNEGLRQSLLPRDRLGSQQSAKAPQRWRVQTDHDRRCNAERFGGLMS